MPPALAQVLSAGFQRKNQPQISLGLILLLFHCRIVILIGKKLCPVIHAANLHIAHADRSELFIQDIGTVSCAVHPAFHNLFRGFLSPGNIFAGASVADALLLQRRTEISSVRSGMGKGRLDFNRPYLSGRLYVLIKLQR